jgi:PAS domain S-box-containing protein
MPIAKRRMRGASTAFRHSKHAAAQFQALLEAAPDAVVIVDAAGRIVIVNGQVERLFGYARGELLDQPVEVLLPDALRPVHQRHRDAYSAAPRTRPMGSGLDLSARRKDGSLFPVEISLSTIQSDAGILITSIIRDVTERKDAADALEWQVQRRTAHLDTLLQSSQELLGARGLDSVLHRAISHALACIPDAQGGAIYLYDPDRQRLVLRAVAGFRAMPRIDVPIELGIHHRHSLCDERCHTACNARLRQQRGRPPAHRRYAGTGRGAERGHHTPARDTRSSDRRAPAPD